MQHVNSYFSMIKRETSIPKWMGGTPDDTTMENDDNVNDNYNDSSANNTLQNTESNTSSSQTSKKQPSTNVTPLDIDLESNNSSPAAKGSIIAVLATGAGLFSDGYVNNGAGTAISMIKTIYPAEHYANSTALSNIASLVFVGTVVGMIVFGYIADYYSRKAAMLVSTWMLIIFSILCAGSWGVGMPTRPEGMFAMLATFRTFLGLGIGGEYPAGSTAAAEASQSLKKGSRNRYFIWFTNSMIDSGFVINSFVAWLLLYICSVPTYASPDNNHGLQAAWRLVLGLGAIPPIALLVLRYRYKESERFHDSKALPISFKLVFKRYTPRLMVLSSIWFLYNFCVYSFSIYSSQIIGSQIKTNAEGIANIKTTFGWNVVFNVFYLPGTILGGLSSDYFGPRLTLFGGLFFQGIVGIIMASQYTTLVENIAPMVVAYGIFQSLGEFGPGNNIGMICAKTCATRVRGRYYAIPAAIGKLGAFVGGYAFPAIANRYGGLSETKAQTVLLYTSSAFCLLAACLATLIPEITQEAVADEDAKFNEILVANQLNDDLT